MSPRNWRADANFDSFFGQKSGVALGYPALHLHRAAHGLDHAAELDDRAILRAFDDPPAMQGSCRID